MQAFKTGPQLAYLLDRNYLQQILTTLKHFTIVLKKFAHNFSITLDLLFVH